MEQSRDLTECTDGQLLEMTVRYEREARIVLDALKQVMLERERRAKDVLPDNVIIFPQRSLKPIPPAS